MQRLDIVICDNVDDALEKGFVYREPEYQHATITKAVVVKNGTEEGNSTVDIHFVDNKGNKFVAMITSNLLKSIPAFVN